MARKKTDNEDVVDDRPLWTVNEKSFVGHSIAEEGATVIYEPDEDSEVGENLSPANQAAQDVIDAQRTPHPDKSDGKKAKNARRAADAAAAGVVDDGGGAASDLA